LDTRNVKEMHSFMTIENDLIDKIIEYTKDDETTKDFCFHPNNANQEYFIRPFKE